MKIKRIIFLISIIYSAVISVFSQTNNTDLIGKWESLNSKPPNAVQLEFKTGNEFIFIDFLVADYKYRIEGNLLISSIEKEYPQKKILIDTSYLQVKPDMIIRSYNRLGWKDTVTMIRDRSYPIDSGKANNFIIGKWKWAYPMGDTATAVFNNDGTWHFSVPKDIYKGVYEMKQDTLSIKNNNSSNSEQYTFKVEGKLLELKDLRSGNQFLYRRAHD